jgi:hypothetical protein
MTGLVMRTLRARPGSVAAVTHCLNTLASATIRRGGAVSVSIFRAGNDPQQLVWLGEGDEERDFASLTLSTVMADWCQDNLTAPPAARSLRLVEEHHRPLRSPGHVWSVEIQTPAERGLGPEHDLRAASADIRLLGGALYRSIDDPETVVLFLALARGVTPSTVGFSAARLGNASICGPLSPISDLRRLDVPKAEPGARRAPFPEWIRSHVECALGHAARLAMPAHRSRR